MKTIILVRGEIAVVSDEDYDYLNKFSWHSCPGGYVKRTVDRNKTVLMHREVVIRMGLQLLEDVDHRDNNPLNNQRDNLRVATVSQNQANSKMNITNVTGFKGVVFNARQNKWQAQIRHRGQRLYLGLFDCPIKAAKKYNEVALRLFGEFAKLNKVEERG